MFFDYTLLNRRTGKFAIIWLVANSKLQYGKRSDKYFRDVMAVDVSKTCEDLMRYVCGEVATTGPRQSRLRLSLYLSSMLAAGSVRIYRRQIQVLLDDVARAFDKFFKLAPIDTLLDDQAHPAWRVTTHPDPVELAPSEDVTTLRALCDDDIILDESAIVDVRGRFGRTPGEDAHGESPRSRHQRSDADINPNLALASDITLREPQLTAVDNLLHEMEDFGDARPPHLRDTISLFNDPLLDDILALSLAPGDGAPPMEPLLARDLDSMLMPPPFEQQTAAQPDEAAPGGPPGEAEKTRSSHESSEGSRKSDGPKSSIPAQPVRIDPSSRRQVGSGAELAVGDGAHLLGDEYPTVQPALEQEQAPGTPVEGQTRRPVKGGPLREGQGPEQRGPEGAPQEWYGPDGRTLPQEESLLEEQLLLQQLPPVLETPQAGGEPARPPLRPRHPRTAPPAADATLEEMVAPPVTEAAPAGPAAPSSSGGAIPGSVGAADAPSAAPGSNEIHHSSMSLPSDVPAPSPRRDRRRRLAVDTRLELDHETMQRRLLDGATDTQRGLLASDDFVRLRRQQRGQCEKLFKQPGHRHLARALEIRYKERCIGGPEDNWPWEDRDMLGQTGGAEVAAPQPEAARERTPAAATGSGPTSLFSATGSGATGGSATSMPQALEESMRRDMLHPIAEVEEGTPAAAAAAAAQAAAGIPGQQQPQDISLPQPPTDEIPLPEQQVSLVVPEQQPPTALPALPEPHPQQQMPLPQTEMPSLQEEMPPPQEEMPPPQAEMPPPPVPVPHSPQAGTLGRDAPTRHPTLTIQQSSSDEELAPTTSTIPPTGSNTFRSASMIPDDLSDRLRATGAVQITFRQLLPPTSYSRLQAAASFAHLLHLHKDRKLRLTQEEAFGDIYINCV